MVIACVGLVSCQIDEVEFIYHTAIKALRVVNNCPTRKVVEVYSFQISFISLCVNNIDNGIFSISTSVMV